LKKSNKRRKTGAVSGNAPWNRNFGIPAVRGNMARTPIRHGAVVVDTSLTIGTSLCVMTYRRNCANLPKRSAIDAKPFADRRKARFKIRQGMVRLPKDSALPTSVTVCFGLPFR
jgi:hypothetical protein